MKLGKLRSRPKLTFTPAGRITPAAPSTFNAEYQCARDHKYAQKDLESRRNTCLLDMSKIIFPV